MARKNENSRQTKKVIHIICEGTHTEPQFFGSIRDRIIDGKYNIGNCEINIIPKPVIPAEADLPGTVEVRGSYRAKKVRRVAKPGETAEGFLTGFPTPLNWIKTAQEKLKESSTDEAWTVFDMDGHPAMAEAFAAAKEEIDGRTVGIAFSSRSFEYYLLLHFEYLYKEFNATECGKRVNGKKKTLKCMLPDAKPGSCQGDMCINGYARSKGYWLKSKSTESMFPLIEDKLNIGIIHAHWLRTESNQKDSRVEYERNPYVTIDKLICRLTNTHVIKCGDYTEIKYDGVLIQIILWANCSLLVSNTSDNRTVILPKDFFLILNSETNTQIPMDERKEVKPDDNEIYMDLNLEQTEVITINNEYVEDNYLFLL